MYLQRLDILGFKSFANKTTITFANGVTAIVGPNGCGKTNVLDSLRWVLGEQRPTLLRGGKMEEVIFNGTREMKPLGMAEVTLTIINDRGVLPTEYHEVQISRRLFRSGESEYLLNKVPCRLKDITDLFLDTGMGPHSYSVIQQDMIDAVISDRAEERRLLFEEAAGITKYKQRKKAALRKLEATENDFLRLKDIYAEVKTQANSLFRQHKKAERYQKIADEIRQWDLYLNSQRLQAIELEKRELRAACDGLIDRRNGHNTELDQVSAALEADRKELLDIEHELTSLGNQIYSESERAHALERQISVSREKRQNSESLIERNTADIASLGNRMSFLEEQELATRKELAEQQLAGESVATELREAETAQAEADRQLMAARTAREAENRRLIELEGKLSSGRTEESSLREQESELARQLGELERQFTDASPRQQELLQQYDQFNARVNELQSRRNELEQRQTALTEQIERSVEEGEEITLEISNLGASIEACEARRNLLADMMLHYEGHESGLVAAMEVRERWPGIAGTVADQFVPVEGLEIALEAALGNMAGFLICHDRHTAESVVAYLKSENKGRIGIVVPDSGTLTPGVRRPEIDIDGFVGWLDTFVSTDESLRPLKEAVLSRTAVFKAGLEPSSLLERLPYGFSAVSSDGIFYSKNIITGGSDDRFPLFRRKEKVQEQEHMIADLTARQLDARERKNAATTMLASSRAEFASSLSTLESLKEEIESAQKGLSELDFQRRTLASEFERWDKDRTYLRNRLDGIRNRQYNLGLDFSQLTGERESLVTTMASYAGRLEEAERQATGALERLARLQVGMVEARSKTEQTSSRLGHLQEIRRDLDATLTAKQDEITRAREEAAASVTLVADLELQLKAAFDKRDELLAGQTRLRYAQTETNERMTGKEARAKELRAERDALGDKIHQLEMRLNSIEAEIRTISDHVREEADIDIHELNVSRPNEMISDDAAREHVQGLKEQLKKFGAVNLLALEEYRTASEREKFLSEQLNDLTTAKNDLATTILRINQTAREMFMTTFEKARENFKTLFVELFSGGEADIMLEDPADPLESNIDIIARPRGKKLLSITMMSGGERALTAISLLFSLYLVKPSPFCILDEIDAPLDDANCHRFLKIIRKFSSQTQFITITHNKITMEAADNLYGITMEQPGVSKLVAVRFTPENGDGTDSVVIEQVVDQAAEPEAPSAEPENTVLPEAIRQRMQSDITVSEDPNS